MSFDTHKITEIVGEKIAQFEADKALHFTGSYGLCFDSEKFDQDKFIESPVDILKAVFDSFREGFRKELLDKGLVKHEEQLDIIFDKIILDLLKLYEFYVSLGFDKNNESDLFADLVGVGLYMVNHSIRMLAWIHYDDKKDKETPDQNRDF